MDVPYVITTSTAWELRKNGSTKSGEKKVVVDSLPNEELK
jgi:hypothetical protein